MCQLEWKITQLLKSFNNNLTDTISPLCLSFYCLTLTCVKCLSSCFVMTAILEEAYAPAGDNSVESQSMLMPQPTLFCTRNFYVIST
jgi:hypothetical protein